MISVVKGRPTSVRLSERALSRVTIVRREPLPDPIETPWTMVCRKLKETADLNRVYFVIIPTSRIRDWEGETILTRDALYRCEMIESISDYTISDRNLSRIDRLVRSPAPVGWENENGSERRRYCTNHCAKCGLHFTSSSAFDEHAIWRRHKHPSKIDKLYPVVGHDTGCHQMGASYDSPLVKYLPFYDQSTRYVPGVRLWEHEKAQKVREYFAEE